MCPARGCPCCMLAGALEAPEAGGFPCRTRCLQACQGAMLRPSIGSGQGEARNAVGLSRGSQSDGGLNAQIPESGSGKAGGPISSHGMGLGEAGPWMSVRAFGKHVQELLSQPCCPQRAHSFHPMRPHSSPLPSCNIPDPKMPFPCLLLSS